MSDNIVFFPPNGNPDATTPETLQQLITSWIEAGAPGYALVVILAEDEPKETESVTIRATGTRSTILWMMTAAKHILQRTWMG